MVNHLDVSTVFIWFYLSCLSVDSLIFFFFNYIRIFLILSASSSSKCKIKLQLLSPNAVPPPLLSPPLPPPPPPPPPSSQSQTTLLRPPSPRASQSPSSSTRSRTNTSNGHNTSLDKNSLHSSLQVTSPSSTVSEAEEIVADVKPPSPVIPKVLVTEPDTSSVSKSSPSGKFIFQSNEFQIK